MSEPTGLELISENGNLGWRLIGKDPSLFGNIGQKAVDFSSSNVSEYTEQKGATGAYSAAFGMNNEASGDFSVALGNNSKATGASSFVIGKDNIASGDYSFVSGIDNKGAALGSFVVGSNNEAYGDDSFAGGYYSKVLNSGGFKTGSYSLAFGSGIEIDNPNSVSFGRFNLNDGNDNSGLYKSFTVGIGISDYDRRNAFEIYDGGGTEYGSIKAPYLQQSTIDADPTGKVLITREYFESKYNHAFDDAPIDGYVYGRKNKGWTRVAELAAVQVFFKGTLPPPSDFVIPGQPGRFFEPGDVYLHYSLPKFVTDGNINNVDGSAGYYDGNTSTGGGEKLWVLRDGSLEIPAKANYWSEFKLSGGIEDVEMDNVKYVRKNKSWVPLGIQQIVYKGTEDPNTLADFAKEGDKYLRESTPYMEYTKLADGTWKSINIEYLNEIPIDKILENADITDATYDSNGNILTATYSNFADKVAGYTSEYMHNTNNQPTQIVYKNENGAIIKTITITYDANGNMTSYIRS